MFHKFVLEAAVLIIIIKYDIHVIFFFFAANSNHVTVFIIIETLHDSAFFVKQLVFFELAFENNVQKSDLVLISDNSHYKRKRNHFSSLFKSSKKTSFNIIRI